MKDVIQRFISYAQVYTTSDPSNEETPSTKRQFDLATILVNELHEMGIKNAELTENCYVYASIPSNLNPDDKTPKIGFVAHVDTSPDAPGENVNPQIHKNYQGGDIELGDSGVVLKYSENPAFANCIGHTIITSDGTTLLGSDDKSGITAIMELAKYFMENDEVSHGEIGIAFTPDEEIGRGVDMFDIEKFGCEYAYTIDGEMPPILNKETFSADHAWVRAEGREIHPGSAKGVMINSVRAIADFITRLPVEIAPESTEGHEPYIHPHQTTGGVGHSEVMLLLRTFNDKEMSSQHDFLNDLLVDVQEKFPDTKLSIEYKKMYRNMFDTLEANPKGCDFMFEAAKRAGLKPVWEPIRGGTDGSILTEKGLPCPNIFTGGQNFHSVQEWLSVDSLMQTIETMKHLCAVWVEEE
jgi:tripeptide aminopeptidase